MARAERRGRLRRRGRKTSRGREGWGLMCPVSRTTSKLRPASRRQARVMTRTPREDRRVDFARHSGSALAGVGGGSGGGNCSPIVEAYELWGAPAVGGCQDLELHARIDSTGTTSIERRRRQARYVRPQLVSWRAGVDAELGRHAAWSPTRNRLFCDADRDEARHVAFRPLLNGVLFFFFFWVGGRDEGRRPAGAPGGDQAPSQPRVQRAPSTRAPPARRLGWRSRRRRETLVEEVKSPQDAEGMLALTASTSSSTSNEKAGTGGGRGGAGAAGAGGGGGGAGGAGGAAGLRDGLTKSARDEHRHVAVGARFLREPGPREPRRQPHPDCAGRVGPSPRGGCAKVGLPEEAATRVSSAASVDGAGLRPTGARERR